MTSVDREQVMQLLPEGLLSSMPTEETIEGQRATEVPVAMLIRDGDQNLEDDGNPVDREGDHAVLETDKSLSSEAIAESHLPGENVTTRSRRETGMPSRGPDKGMAARVSCKPETSLAAASECTNSLFFVDRDRLCHFDIHL